MLRIFLAHAKEDEPAVIRLYQQLKAKGYHPWLDKEDLLPGQSWRAEISKAIKNSQVFIACLSNSAVAKHSYVQRELKMALSACADKPPGSIYLIPVRLDDCEIPDLRQEYGMNLRDLQWVDLFEPNGFEKLIRSLQQSFSNSHASSTPTDLALDVVPLAVLEQDIAMQWSNPRQKRWALLVGINEYGDQSFSTLRYCVNDVLSLEGLLEQVGYTVVCMHDDLPVRDARFPRFGYIKAEFKRLKAQFEPDDLLLVYFACHGTRGGDGLPRLAAEDTRSETLADTAISVADVEEWMRESGAGQLVLMLDACHMGQGTDERRAIVVDTDFLRAVCKRQPKGFALLAASTAEQASREFGNLEHGLFSYYVLSGLSGVAKAADSKQVTLGSLKRYILGELTREAVKAGISQRPQVRLAGDLDIEEMVLVDLMGAGLPGDMKTKATDTSVSVVSQSESVNSQKTISSISSNRDDVLNSIPVEEIVEALLRAFPSKQKLKMMLFYGLGKELEAEVNADGPLREVVFNLVKWTDANELRLDLLRAASKANPKKSELKKIANVLGLFESS